MDRSSAAKSQSSGGAKQAESDLVSDVAAALPDSAAMTEREARLIAGTYTGSDVEAVREELSAAEARARASQEFIAHTLDYYGERLPSQWKAHARAVLADA